MSINKIVVHCSDSPQCRNDSAETIHKWHKERGFDGIGYHYVIVENGDVENGRPEFWRGAHVRAHNKDSLGICLIGVDSFTTEQFVSLRTLIDSLLTRYDAAQVCGHTDLDSKKTCPNFDVKRWYYERH